MTGRWSKQGQLKTPEQSGECNTRDKWGIWEDKRKSFVLEVRRVDLHHLRRRVSHRSLWRVMTMKMMICAAVVMVLLQIWGCWTRDWSERVGTSIFTERLERDRESDADSINNFLTKFTVATNKRFTVAKQIHLCTGDWVEHREEQLPDDQRSEPDRRRCSWSERKHKNTWRRTWKRPGHVWSSQSSQSVRDYCQENIIDINNNILDFKDAVREVNGKINKKILGCGKNIETCKSEWIHFSEEIKPVTIADLNMANDLWLAWK